MNQIVNDLIKFFLDEGEHRVIDIPTNYVHKREFLRGLMNVRDAKIVPSNIIEKENELLQKELEEKKITNIEDFNDKFSLWQGDITTIKCDAIVNPATSNLLGCFKPNHNCIDNKVHTYAGISLRLKCKEITKGSNIETSKVILTEGYNLPCDYIIHAVKPIVDNELTDEKKEEIKDFYINSLDLAKNNNLKSICIPNISINNSELKKEVSEISLSAVINYLKDDDFFEKVVFNLFTLDDFNIYNETMEKLFLK